MTVVQPTHDMDRHEITILSATGDHVLSASLDMEADEEDISASKSEAQKTEAAVA